jgi:hypothetical protein
MGERLKGDHDFADLFRALEKRWASAMSSNGKIRAMAGLTVLSSSLNRLSLGGSTEHD